MLGWYSRPIAKRVYPKQEFYKDCKGAILIVIILNIWGQGGGGGGRGVAYSTTI